MWVVGNKDVEQIERLLARGQLKEAFELYFYKEAISSDIDPSLKIKLYHKILAIKPDDIEVRLALAKYYHKDGNLVKAETEYRTVLRYDFLNTDALYNLGELCEQKGNYDHAILAYRKLSDYNRDPKTKEIIGQLYFKLKKPDYGVDFYLEAADGYYQMKAFAEVARIYDYLTTTLPDDQRVNQKNEEFKQLLKDSQISSAVLTSDNLDNLALKLFFEGRVEEAIKQWQQLIALEPTNARAHYNIGKAYKQQGNLSLAAFEFNCSLERDSENTDALNSLGELYLKDNRPKKALELWNKVLDIKPNDFYALNSIGRVYAQLNKTELAKEKFLKVIELDPNDLYAHTNLGHIYLQQGNPDAAIKEWEKCLELFPQDVYTHNNLGRAYLELGHVQEAINRFYKATQINANDLYAHSYLGIAYLKVNDYLKAKEKFEKVIAIEPNYMEIYNNLGLIHLRERNINLAVIEFRKALLNNERDPYPINNLAFCYYMQNEIDSAIEEMRKAVILDINNPYFYNNLGYLLFKAGEERKAKTAWEKSWVITPNIYSLQGLVLSSIIEDNREHTLDYCKKLIDLIPNNKYKDIGSVLLTLEEDKDTKKTENLLAMFKVMEETEPSWIDSLASLFQQGKLEEFRLSLCSMLAAYSPEGDVFFENKGYKFNLKGNKNLFLTIANFKADDFPLPKADQVLTS